MKIKGQTYFLMLILAVVLLVGVLSLGLKPISRLLPLTIGGITLFLILIQLVIELRGAKTPAESKTTTITGEAQCGPGMTTDGTKRRGYLIASIWIAGAVIAIYLLGFNIAIAAFVLTYMKVHDTGWLQSIIYAVVMDAAMYGIFQYVMHIILWPGIIPSLFLP